MADKKPFLNRDDPGAKLTARARPKRVRRGAPLRERLTQPGHMPDPIASAVIGSLAVVQGSVRELIKVMEAASETPILFAGVVHLDASGMFTRNFIVGFQCVAVANLSGALVTVTGAAGDPGRPPNEGAGVHQIPSNSAGRFAMTGHSITVYGPAGGYVDLAVAAKWVPGL